MMKYPIGHVLKQEAAGREHTYTLTSTFQHRNRRGFDADVLVWTGTCATCGCLFEATSGAAGDPYLIRNCPAHRRKTAPKQRPNLRGTSEPETCATPAPDMRCACLPGLDPK